MTRLDSIIDQTLANLIKREVEEDPTDDEVADVAEVLISGGYLPYDPDSFKAVCRWCAIKKPRKGLLLSGAAGTGKTMFAKMLASGLGTLNDWPFVPAKKFVAEWVDAEGRMDRQFWYRTLGVYESETHRTNVVIDDLGQEQQGICYGLREEVMDEVICRRYRDWQDAGRITVITTNLAPADLEKRYGRRVTDRLSEMCGYIQMNGKSNRGKDYSTISINKVGRAA